jgi:hypothetical protein
VKVDKSNILKTDLITQILDSKQEAELFKLLMGLSDCNIEESKNSEFTLEETKLISSARSHLSFIVKYGESKTHVIESGMHYFAYPDKFRDWLMAGAPGVSLEELKKVLAH